jgi:glycosyltransferase involved in cell wall biosynthesis
MKLTKRNLQILESRIVFLGDLIFELLAKQNMDRNELTTLQLLRELSLHSEKTRHLLFVILNMYYPDESQFSKFEYKISTNSFESILEEYFLTLNDKRLRPELSYKLIDVTETSVAPYNTGIQRVTRKIFSNKTPDFIGIAWNRNSYIPQNLDAKSLKNLTAWNKENVTHENVDNYIVFKNHKIEMNLLTRTISWVARNNYSRDLIKKLLSQTTQDAIVTRVVANFGIEDDKDLLIIYGADIFIPELMFLDERLISIYVLLRRLGLVKITMLVHDAIPLTFPQFVASSTIAGYVKYTRLVLVADEIFCPTRYESKNVSRILKAIDSAFDKDIKVLTLSGEVMDTRAIVNSKSEMKPRSYKILMLGSLDPRKNQIGMMQALEVFYKRVNVPLSLSIVAGGEWLSDEIHNQIEISRKIGIEIRLLKSLSDEKLMEEFLSSDLLYFCSFAEGFGLPIAEAGYLGIPVVTSQNSAMEEVALRFCSKFKLVDSRSIDSMANGLHQMYVSSVEINHPDSVSRKWIEVSHQFLDIKESEAT